MFKEEYKNPRNYASGSIRLHDSKKAAERGLQFVAWKFVKGSEYKHFKIKDLKFQDDYASMEQVIRRRFMRYVQNDSGFNKLPDLLLIDGGINHANVALSVLRELRLDLPVFGMVKDDRHRTHRNMGV